MSIAVLTQVSDEMRRLAIAGSAVACGDFRLKKLVAPLEKAGEKAPVFGKVAQAIQTVVDSTEKTASVALLELTSLVNAILYTQGETGLAGTLQPIETTDLGTTQVQTGARVLKPLLEALTATGSGRAELIRDAIERGTFRDLRLVKPALKAIDETSAEIGELIANKVLPIYGKAILPELRAAFDIKGKIGNVRRLRLMHRLDPLGTRDLVKRVLDEGAKDLKVAAIETLGDTDEDLSYLLEQSKAKLKDVRCAALGALTKLDSAEATAALQKALTKDDFEPLISQLQRSSNVKLQAFIQEQADAQLAVVLKATDKKLQGPAILRLQKLLCCMDDRHDSATAQFLLKCCDHSSDFEKMKSEPSGTDLNELVAYLMALATPETQARLIEVRDSLTGPMLTHAFVAGRQSLKAATLYDMFAACLTSLPEKRTKKTELAFERAEAIENGLVAENSDDVLFYCPWGSSLRQTVNDRDGVSKLRELDPRWLDLVVQCKNFEIVQHLARPGHAELNAFLSAECAQRLTKKNVHDADDVIEIMIDCQHPEATTALIEMLRVISKGTSYYYLGYWVGRLIVQLPQSSAAELEAVLPTLPEKVIDQLMEYVLQLKNKTP